LNLPLVNIRQVK